MRRGVGKPLWLLVSTTMVVGVAMPLIQATTAVRARAASAPHILELMEENESYGSIIGNSAAPFINSLAGTYALATNWSSNEHVSWKDYNIALGGSDFGKQSGIPASNKNLANELDNMGTSWKGYMESMPSACDTSSSGNYDAGHDPFVHFLSITNNSSECKTNVVPYAQSGMVTDLNNGSPPAFVWVTPNQCDDMHTKCGSSNPIKVGDTWLSNFIPAVQSTSWYQSGGIIVLTWDEAATSDTSGCCGDPGGGHVATLVISANSKGHFTSIGDHDGTLHAIEAAYGVGFLGASGSGHGDLTGAFGNPPPPGTISGTVTDANTLSPIVGATVSCSCSGTNQITVSGGTYQFSNVPPNTVSTPYSMTFSASGYQPQTVNTVVVSSGGTTTVNQALTPGSPGTISGTVTDANTLSPIVGRNGLLHLLGHQPGHRQRRYLPVLERIAEHREHAVLDDLLGQRVPAADGQQRGCLERGYDDRQSGTHSGGHHQRHCDRCKHALPDHGGDGLLHLFGHQPGHRQRRYLPVLERTAEHREHAVLDDLLGQRVPAADGQQRGCLERRYDDRQSTTHSERRAEHRPGQVRGVDQQRDVLGSLADSNERG